MAVHTEKTEEWKGKNEQKNCQAKIEKEKENCYEKSAQNCKSSRIAYIYT